MTACHKKAIELAMNYSFVTEVTSLVVEENYYYIKNINPKRLEYSHSDTISGQSSISLPLNVPPIPTIQELDQSGKQSLDLKKI